MNQQHAFKKNILIAVDNSENARRAVLYVAQLLEDTKGFRISIVHIISKPEEDFFSTAYEEEKWLNQYNRSIMRYCPSMATCILEEKDKTEYSTVVVG